MSISVSGPISVDRFPEDEVDVDVEQCSDSENAPRTPRTTSNSTVPSTSPPSPSDEDRLTPEPAQVRKVKCTKYINTFILSCIYTLYSCCAVAEEEIAGNGRLIE